jgi:ribosome-associated heat shock protein Hsp15
MSEQEDKTGVRIDKWLWAARFFKTRSLAAQAVSGGKVHLNAARTKPARELRIGDELNIRRGEVEWVIVVCGLSSKRGPAKESAQLYEETEQSKLKRQVLATQLRAEQMMQPYIKGRPSKKERRDLLRFTRGRK